MDLFDGAIAGLGTASGTRLVVGVWPGSPYGSVTDVMIERADGHRILLAPTPELAAFIADTYSFDEVRLTPVRCRRQGRTWHVRAGDLSLSFTVGRRTPLGWLLRLVPYDLARASWWTRVTDPVARLMLAGVRTRVGQVGGHRSTYSALDVHSILSVSATFEGRDLGPLRPVLPPVRFGVASTPAAPSLTRVVSRVSEGCAREEIHPG